MSSNPLTLDLDPVLDANEKEKVRMEIIARDQMSKNIGYPNRPKSSVPFYNR